MSLVTIEGDRDCCTVPLCGACFDVEPVVLQDFVYINGVLVIVHDTEFDAPCIASEKGYTRSTQTWATISGIPINRDGDASAGCHSFGGIEATQDFVNIS